MDTQTQSNEPTTQKIAATKRGLKSSLIIFGFVFLIASAALTYLILNKQEPKGNQTPPDEQFITFLEIGKEYDTASRPVDVGGKLAYIATRDGKSFAVLDGKEIGKEYARIQEIADIGGKLAFSATDEKGVIHVLFEEKEVAEVFLVASKLKNVGNKLAFKAYRTKKDRDLANFFIYYGGVELGEEYDFIFGDPVEIDGNIAFLVRSGESNFLIKDGEKASKDYSGIYYFLIPIGNSFAFKATKPPKEPVEFTGDTTVYAKRIAGKNVIVFGDKEFGEEYEDVFLPFDLNGKLLYLAEKDGKTILIYDGRQIAKEYDNITNVTNVNGKLAFVGQQGSDIFIDFDGKKIEGALGPSERIQYLQNVGGKLAYVLKKEDGFHLIYDGKNVGVYDYIPPRNGDIDFIIEANGKLVFAAKMGEKWDIVYDGKTVAQYDGIDYLTTINRKLAFGATQGFGPAQKKFIVIQK